MSAISIEFVALITTANQRLNSTDVGARAREGAAAPAPSPESGKAMFSGKR